jgi:glycerophosphoryl diester phosphodiesterase
MRRRKRFVRRALLALLVVALIVGFAEAQPQLLLAPFLNTKADSNFLVVAHRGASKYAPENTNAAFKKALELGANAIEFDVLFTRDDVPVIAHHYDLADRVPEEQRPAIISEMDIHQVKQLDVGSWFSEQYKGETIPTVREVLAFLKGKVKRVYLHDKDENDYSGPRLERIRIVADEIRRAQMQEYVVVMVDSGFLHLWQQLAPDLSFLQCWNGPDNQQGHSVPLGESYRRGIRHMGLYHNRGNYSILGRAIAKAGLTNIGTFIGFWPTKDIVQHYKAKQSDFTVFTVNDRFSMKAYIDAGVDAIGTDDPPLLLSIVNRQP